jgi:monovalent cation:H+ antiporter-2, CPA2 family
VIAAPALSADHGTELVATIVIALSAAFVGGAIAARLRAPTIAGYLLAGIVVGPFTPGYVADTGLVRQLAEIGVILLMFGVGTHFSLGDLLAVRRVAVPGGIGQSAIAATAGFGLARLWGSPVGESVVFGLALSVASTVVLLRALADRGGVTTEEGRIAVGWLVVEDILTVVALVLLPVLAESLGGTATGESGGIVVTVLLTVAKLGGFVALMLVVGVRVLPWVLDQTERFGGRELYLLGVLAIALGIAFGAAELFGVSVALGAFLAGVVVGGSEHRERASSVSEGLQDVFTVLFFVSVGMLIDPAFLLHDVWRVLAVVALVVLVKAATALAIVRVIGRPARTGWTVAVGLAQVGEFSFILAELGRSLGLLSDELQSLILAGALVTIVANPIAFRLLDRRWSATSAAT